jgi:hypothetical protein
MHGQTGVIVAVGVSAQRGLRHALEHADGVALGGGLAGVAEEGDVHEHPGAGAVHAEHLRREERERSEEQQGQGLIQRQVASKRYPQSGVQQTTREDTHNWKSRRRSTPNNSTLQTAQRERHRAYARRTTAHNHYVAHLLVDRGAQAPGGVAVDGGRLHDVVDARVHGDGLGQSDLIRHLVAVVIE